MRPVLRTAQICRARPLLGTIVSIGVRGTTRRHADRAIDVGFAAVAEIQRLMSFHESESDVSRLNSSAFDRPVAVDARTMRVVRQALDFSASSHGCFDITVADQLVAQGLLPRPACRHDPDRHASWRDIELTGEDRIRFHRPLWIDLGGIAKGYAVDHALARMAVEPGVQVCINAGGDLRVSGPAFEPIFLRVAPTRGAMPVVRLHDGSIASSSGRDTGRLHCGRRVGPHVHGLHRKTMGRRSFVSVIAQECVVADALTKIVMAQGVRSDCVLRRFDATAYVCNSAGQWRMVGAGA